MEKQEFDAVKAKALKQLMQGKSLFGDEGVC